MKYENKDNILQYFQSIHDAVEEGHFNIQSVGTQTIINESNVFTDAGPVQSRTLRFEIEHTVYPE